MSNNSTQAHIPKKIFVTMLSIVLWIVALTASGQHPAVDDIRANGREMDGFAELVQRMGASAVMATLWEVNDNSTPVLMREFYRNREKNDERTKAEALRQGQLALLTGTITPKPLSSGRKRSALGTTKLVIVPNNAQGLRPSTGGSREIYVAQKDAPPFERRKASPFAHPYYWAPFILIGNWK